MCHYFPIPIFICTNEVYWFIWVNFISSHFGEVVFQLARFRVGFWGSLLYTTTSCTNSVTLTSSFLFYIHLISSYCLITLARISSTILNRHRESGYHCLVPVLVGLLQLSFFLLLYWPLICYILLLLCLDIGLELQFINTLKWSGTVFCQMFFQHLMKWPCDIFLFVYVLDYVHVFFCILSQPWIPRMKPTWLWWMKVWYVFGFGLLWRAYGPASRNFVRVWH